MGLRTQAINQSTQGANRRFCCPDRIGIPEQPKQNCGFPKNPFTDPNLNPTNPTSWSEAISKFMGGLAGSLFCLESESTDGILGNKDYDPYMNRHKKFIARALLGRMYTLLEWINMWTEENKKANKMEGLALAAK